MKINENIAMFSTTSKSEKREPAAGGTRFAGNDCMPRKNTTMPSGTLSAKSHGHDATDKMAAATDGPATAAVATTSELIAMPRPSLADG